MTVVYNAHWSATLSDPIATVAAVVAAECDALRAPDRCEVITAAHTVVNESGGVLDLRAGIDALATGGQRRVTRVSVTGTLGEPHHLRVSVEHHGSPDTTNGDVVAAPRLVRHLLSAGPDAVLGALKVTTTPRMLAGTAAAESLAEIVTDFERELPIVVFATDRDRRDRATGGSNGGSASPLAAVGIAAIGLAGTARVVAVDAACADAFTGILGAPYGLPAGTGLRVYLPGVDPAVDADSIRHPSLDADRVYTDPRGAARHAASAVLAYSNANTATPAPAQDRLRVAA